LSVECGKGFTGLKPVQTGHRKDVDAVYGLDLSRPADF